MFVLGDKGQWTYFLLLIDYSYIGIESKNLWQSKLKSPHYVPYACCKSRIPHDVCKDLVCTMDSWHHIDQIYKECAKQGYKWFNILFCVEIRPSTQLPCHYMLRVVCFPKSWLEPVRRPQCSKIDQRYPSNELSDASNHLSSTSVEKPVRN